MRRVRVALTAAAAVGCLALLAACGGGGSAGSAGGASGSSGTTALVLSATSVTQHATITQASAGMPSIDLTVANRPSGSLYLGYRYSTKGVANIGFSQPTDVPPSLVITFQPPYQLKPGTYTDTLDLELCADSQCAQPLTPVQVVSISYIVAAPAAGSEPAIILSTRSVSAQVFLTSSPNTLPQAPSVSVSFRNVPLDPQVTPTTTQAGVESVYYGPIAPTVAGLTIYLRSPLSTGAGVFHDTITVNACLDEACNNPIAPVTLAVTYTITNTVSGANGYTIDVYPIAATDMVWDAVNTHLLVSTPATAPNAPSSIAVLDPATGELNNPIPVAGVPRLMAIAADSSYLYVGLDTPSSVQRYVLPGMTPDIVIPLPAGLSGVATYAKTIEVAPDNPRTISVTLADASGNDMGLIVFDDATPRTGTFGVQAGMATKLVDSAEWGATGSVLFGASNDIVGGSGDLYGFTVNAAGVQLQNDVPGSPSGRGHFAQSLLYLDGGTIVDPSTFSVTGNFVAPLANLLVVPDAAAGRAFFVNTDAATDTFTGAQLESFDLTTHAPIATVPLPYANLLSRRLIRWGTNGLGFVDIFHGNIVVVSGSFVAP